MKLTLRQMEIFINVVVSGHLTNVAKDMKLSQSAISMSIKELENIIYSASNRSQPDVHGLFITPSHAPSSLCIIR